MAEIYDEGQNNSGPRFDFEVAESQFKTDGLAELALEGFGLTRASYPAYSYVQNNMVSAVRWTGAPNSAY